MAAGRTIVLVDESGFRLLPMVVRAYAPRGQTPVLGSPLSWDHLSVFGAITLDGELYTQIRPCSIKGPDVVRFLHYLLRCIPGNLLVIWDNLPAHRCRAVKDFLAQGGARRLELIALPAYAPELNPAEGVWDYLKRVELANVCCQDKTELRYELRRAVKRLRQKPHALLGCLKEPGIYV